MRNYLKKIAQIVYEYSKSQKVVDKEFITKVSELLMKHFGVDHYINDVFLADMNQNYLCGYDFYNKIIFIDYNELYDFILENIDKENKSNFLSSEDYIFLKINLSFVSAIAHEIIHASQYKKIDKGINNIETELLKLSFENNLTIMKAENNNRKLTDKERDFIVHLNNMEKDSLYYNALPSERMANIGAMKVNNDIASHLDDNKAKDYTGYFYERSKLMGYSCEDDCPSAYIRSYHSKARNFFELECDASTDYDINKAYYIKRARELRLDGDEKLYYGLPIDINSYRWQIDKTRSFIKKLVDKR